MIQLSGKHGRIEINLTAFRMGNDVMWAMTTRFQADVDMIPIPGVRLHPLDPSSDPSYSPSISYFGIACKAIFDCTVPFHLKDRFRRSQFMDVDPGKFAPELFD